MRENCTEILINNYLRKWANLSASKTEKRAWVTWLNPSLRTPETFIQIDKMVGGWKKGKPLGLPVRLRLADWVLIKTRVKGVKVDRTEMKVYKNWYLCSPIYRMLRKRQFIIAYFLVFTRKVFNTKLKLLQIIKKNSPVC